MTPTNKCQHDGEMKTGWDELTCKKCGWILPSGQRIGIHFGWFPSHEAHKEFKKYRTYIGMGNTYPIDASKSAEVQNMTQTNNERVDITPLEQINAVQSIRNAETLDDALRVMNGLAANGWLRLWDNATHPDGTSYRDKLPISQNEQPKRIPERWNPISEEQIEFIALQDKFWKGNFNNDKIDWMMFAKEIENKLRELNATPTTSLTSETNKEVGE